MTKKTMMGRQKNQKLQVCTLYSSLVPMYEKPRLLVKVLRLSLQAEVQAGEAKARRSKTTGSLVVTMPKVDPHQVRGGVRTLASEQRYFLVGGPLLAPRRVWYGGSIPETCTAGRVLRGCFIVANGREKGCRVASSFFFFHGWYGKKSLPP